MSWSWTVSKYKVPKLKNLYKVTLLAVVLDLANKILSCAAVVKITTNFSFNCFGGNASGSVLPNKRSE